MPAILSTLQAAGHLEEAVELEFSETQALADESKQIYLGIKN